MPDEPNGMRYRVSEIERRIAKVEDLPSQVASLNVKVDNLHDDQRDMRETVKSLRTALFVFSLSIAGSAVAFAFAVLQLTK